MRTPFFSGVAKTAAMLVLAMFSITALADEIESYRLTEDALNRYERATEALYQFAEAHPEMAQQLENDAEDEEEDDTEGDPRLMAQQLDARAPGLRAAVEKSGMKLEEYFTFSIVMAANAFAVVMADQFGAADESALSPVQRANIQFVRKHMQRFEDFGARMKQKYPSVMQDDEEEYSDDDYSDEEYADEYADQ